MSRGTPGFFLYLIEINMFVHLRFRFSSLGVRGAAVGFQEIFATLGPVEISQIKFCVAISALLLQNGTGSS